MNLTVENVLKRIREARIHNMLNKSSLDYGETENIIDFKIEFLNKNFSKELSVFEKRIPQFGNKFEDDNTVNVVTVLLFYTLIIVISIFGNCIVWKTVLGNSRVKSTINIYILNLAISDLMITFVNIPLQLTEILLRNFPLGMLTCKFLHFMGSLTISVSTLTMACIALDRFRVTAHPLKPRPSIRSTVHKILLIWIAACVISSPYAWISDVQTDVTYVSMIRCRIIYPHPEVETRKYITLLTLAIQFVIPLTVASIIHFRICAIIWKRKSIGSITRNQREHQRVGKKKTIRMLIIVLIIFVVCWSPQLAYHTYQDFRGNVNNVLKHSSTIWLICHWFAMSSVCFNPFIYCWFNNEFQKVAKDYLRCCFPSRMIRDRHPKVGFLPQFCKEELLVPKRSSNSQENNNSRSDCNDLYEKDTPQPKILTLSKTVTKLLMNPSINVSACIPKENTKKETFSTFVEETQFKMSESEAFV